MITPIQQPVNVAVQAANPNAQALLTQFMQGGGQAVPVAGQGPTATKAGTPLTLGNQLNASLNAAGGTGLKILGGQSPNKALASDPGYEQYLRLSGKMNTTPAQQPAPLSNNAPPINWSSLMSGQGMG